eukprot:jgi/Botrbrau1/5630/Bobra.55_1s0019.1
MDGRSCCSSIPRKISRTLNPGWPPFNRPPRSAYTVMIRSHNSLRQFRQLPMPMLNPGDTLVSSNCEPCRSPNVTLQEGGVSRATKEAVLKQRACVLWFTGLSGSGKSTVALAVEHALASRGVITTLLDGDNLRHGLCCDLSFTKADREENIRRSSEVARLFVQSGIIALCCFISPYRLHREAARARVKPGDFVEVYVKTPLEVCEQRDTKGLYKLAREGKIKCFTGIDDPYEVPEHPEINPWRRLIDWEDLVLQRTWQPWS